MQTNNCGLQSPLGIELALLCYCMLKRIKIDDQVMGSKISQNKSRSLQAPPQITMKTIVFTQENDASGSWLQFQPSQASQSIHFNHILSQPKSADFKSLRTLSKLSSCHRRGSENARKPAAATVYRKQPYQRYHADSQSIRLMSPESNRATIFILNSEPQASLLLVPKADMQSKSPSTCNPKCFPKRPIKFKNISTKTKTYTLQNQFHIQVKKDHPHSQQVLTTRVKSKERNCVKDYRKRAVSSRPGAPNKHPGLTPWNIPALKQDEKQDQNLLESAHIL